MRPKSPRNSNADRRGSISISRSRPTFRSAARSGRESAWKMAHGVCWASPKSRWLIRSKCRNPRGRPIWAPSFSLVSQMPQKKIATFGAGCFWGPEAKFRRVEGVLDAAVGYMGGHVKNPTYRMVCTDETGHAEVVQVNMIRRRFHTRSCSRFFGRCTIPPHPIAKASISEANIARLFSATTKISAPRRKPQRSGSEVRSLCRSDRDRDRAGQDFLSRRGISSALSRKDRPGRPLLTSPLSS